MISCALVKFTKRSLEELVRLATVGVNASPMMATTKAAIITPVVILPFLPSDIVVTERGKDSLKYKLSVKD